MKPVPESTNAAPAWQSPIGSPVYKGSQATRRRTLGNKKILCILAVVACLWMIPADVCAASIQAASCSRAAVQRAIQAARSGDTVLVPGPCSVSWSPGVVIQSWQAITLESTRGQVTISGAPALIVYQSSSAPTRITGLMFVTIGTSRDPTIRVEGKFSPLSATARIDHSTFRSNAGGTWIETAGGAPVLIDHNSLSAGGAAEMIHNVAFGPDRGTASGWTTDVVPGSANMVFLEDNTFTCTDRTYICNAVQSYYGARTVVRHNAMFFTQVDQHGTQGLPWARWWEIYDNTFYSMGLNQCCFMALRGGSGVVWGNRHADRNAAPGGIGLFVEAPRCSSGYPSPGYPAMDQIGRGLNQQSSPAYFWDNSADMPVIAGEGKGCLAQGIDYMLSSERPAAMKRCQSAADRKAGCPVPYTYVPFKYPFPLNTKDLPDPMPQSRAHSTSKAGL